MSTTDAAETGDDFTELKLFSFVAWDRGSWPGNDFYLGARSTDDGVKAAATNMMQAMTGIEGIYNPRLNRYCQPIECENWQDVILKNKIDLEVVNNLVALPREDRL